MARPGEKQKQKGSHETCGGGRGGWRGARSWDRLSYLQMSVSCL